MFVCLFFVWCCFWVVVHFCDSLFVVFWSWFSVVWSLVFFGVLVGCKLEVNVCVLSWAKL